MNTHPTENHEENRRAQERYIASPMHHAISVRPFTEDHFVYNGHAYDISEGGICFELDDPIEPGEMVGLMVHLPIGFDRGPGRAVFATGRVVWLSDVTEPGPVRMGVVFHDFTRAGDQDRLRRFLHQGIQRSAAA